MRLTTFSFRSLDSHHPRFFFINFTFFYFFSTSTYIHIAFLNVWYSTNCVLLPKAECGRAYVWRALIPHPGQFLFQWSIVPTISPGGGVLIGFVLTLGFGDCLLIEIVHTLDSGDCPLIEIGQTNVFGDCPWIGIVEAIDFEDHQLIEIVWAIGFECYLWIGIV